MKKLLRIEWLKVNRYLIFWGMLVLAFAALTTAFWGIDNILSDIRGNAAQKSPIPIPEVSIYEFPWIWHNLVFIAGTRLFLFLPAFIIILMTTNEITFRTQRQHIIDGLTRNQYFAGKAGAILIFAFAFSVFVLLNGLILGLLNTPSSGWIHAVEKMEFLAGYFLQVAAYGFLAFMLSLLLKKSLLAMGIMFVWSVVAEPVIQHYLKKPLNQYLPVNSIAGLIELPNSPLMKMFGFDFKENIEWQGVLTATIWTLIFMGISWIYIRKKNL